MNITVRKTRVAEVERPKIENSTREEVDLRMGGQIKAGLISCGKDFAFYHEKYEKPLEGFEK